MKQGSDASFPREAQVSLTLIGYVPPSLNEPHGLHWSIRHRGNSRVMIELLSSIERSASGSSTKTMPLELQKLLRMCSFRLASSLATTHRRSKSRSSKKKSAITIKNAPKLRSVIE